MARVMRSIAALFLVVVLLPVAGASAEPAVGVIGTQRLYFFDTTTPSTGRVVPITGLTQPVEDVIGLDWRPATGELFAVTVPGGILNNALVSTYSVDIDTGAATLVGTIAGGTIPGAADVPYGADFNPRVDRIRMVGNNNESFRVNPTNGTLAANDSDLTFTAPATGPISAVAYDRNVAPGGPTAPPDPTRQTTLFAIDAGADRLDLIGGIDGTPSPNGGAVTSVGPLGVAVDNNSDAGLDISPGGAAYAALRTGSLSRLFTIDLTTGAATLVGSFPFEVRELTILPADNCPTIAGNGQPDTDGDGKGDACDDDIDGDGWTNAYEATVGTDPGKADSDGDGKADPADACPTVAAATSNGCPPVPPPLPPDTTAPTVTFAKLASKMKRKTFLKGVTVTFTANESSAFAVDLLGKAKGATLAKAADVVLATKSIKLANGAQKVTLKPSKKLVGKSKKFSVRIQVTATDAAGNRKTVSKTIKVSG